MIRVAINGFGRIGRSVFRILSSEPNVEIVAINDIFALDTLAYLLKYDTVMGTFAKTVSHTQDSIVVDGRPSLLTRHKDPKDLPWAKLGIDVVLESTGIFASRSDLEKHLAAGAKKVLLTVPPKDDIDAMVVMGVNDNILKPEHRLVSNASCTTNCLAPLAKVLDDNFGIVRGMMNTIHAYTNDQRLTDLPHKDLRRARAAAENIIPTTTGAARAVGKVMPHLKGLLDGMATRVPVSDGSMVDLVVELKAAATKDTIHSAMQKAAAGPLKGILEYCTEPLVSSDIIGNPHSSIFDSLLTTLLGDRHVRVVSWYDNEWGYSNRCVDLVKRLASLKN